MSTVIAVEGLRNLAFRQMEPEGDSWLRAMWFEGSDPQLVEAWTLRAILAVEGVPFRTMFVERVTDERYAGKQLAGIIYRHTVTIIGGGE